MPDGRSRRQQQPISGRALLLGVAAVTAVASGLSYVPLVWLERMIMATAVITVAVVAIVAAARLLQGLIR